MTFQINFPPTQEARKCGRPTKARTPCKGQPHGYLAGCALHNTDDEIEIAALLDRAVWLGYERGSKSEKGSQKLKIEHLEKTVRRLEKKLDAAHRKFFDGSAQLVTVGRYGYRWTGSPTLEVGDEVMLPENYVSLMQHGPGPWPGQVTALGSTFDGDHSTIVKKA